jgi:hypothetical protein
MPFNLANTLPPNPDVRIFFSGLMIIQPDAEGKTCEVFVNNRADNHQFSIEIRQRRTNLPDAVLMRHFGPLALANSPTFGFHIEASNPKGVERYTGPQLAGGEDSLNLAIDLNDARFHSTQPDVDVSAGRPSIVLNDGIFYTADQASGNLGIKLVRGETQDDMGPFATLIGANIYLNDNETLTVFWTRNGAPQTLEIAKPQLGASFEIYIINDPLFVDREAITERHDDLSEYYLMLPSVPLEERCRLEIPEDAFTDDRGTPTTLCMSTVKGP